MRYKIKATRQNGETYFVYDNNVWTDLDKVVDECAYYNKVYSPIKFEIVRIYRVKEL